MKYPVVDGDTNADIYGTAETAEDAMAIAADVFADPLDHAELYGPIVLQDGTVLEKGWVVLTQDRR